MRLAVLTKPFGALGAAALAARLADVGADGADLLVRPGYSGPSDIGAVSRELERAGLGLDVVSTDLLEVDDSAHRVLGACAQAGAGLVRVGFYRYDPDVGYRHGLDQARRRLAGLARLAARVGVRLAVQLHHGTLHSSAALAVRLTEDLPDVWFYADPGNQVKEGSEDWRLMLDLLGARVACVGVKNAAWSGDRFEWQPFAEGGVVPWPSILQDLRDRGYGGPLSLHVHYPAADPRVALKRDVGHLRGIS